MREIGISLDMLFGAIRRIQLLKSVPRDLDDLYLDGLHSAALNFCTAVLEYLTLAIEHMKQNLASEELSGLF
jgi:hypothetical protein